MDITPSALVIPEQTGIMICGHGSRDQRAVDEFAHIAKVMQQRFPTVPVEYGYLEFATPIIRNGLDKLRAQGVRHVLAIPGMLFAAGHAKNDIPSVLNLYQAQHPEMKITYGRELAIAPGMMQAAGDRLKQAITQAGLSKEAVSADTLLMVVGRGASDPDANGNVAKVMRLLWEGIGFAWGETAYSGVTFPLVDPGLRHAARLGFKNIIIFPYFLFNGILVQRIYDAADTVAADFPDLQIYKAGYLNDHQGVVATMEDRLSEIIEGSPDMNCQMCKYRTQILGFEEDLGRAQESHHHHVEGLSDREEGEHHHDHHHHGHDHGHSHSHDGHDHDHHHPVYPHADHPLGPKTLQS